MIGDDGDIARSSVFPGETNPPLVIDANAPLARPVAPQAFEPVAWRHPEIAERTRRMQQAQLAQGNALDIAGQLATAPAGPDQLGFRIRKAVDRG